MALKVIMFEHGKRKSHLAHAALEELFYNMPNPNLPAIPSEDTAVGRINCRACGVACWTQRYSTGMCDDCLSLQKVEQELNQKLVRMEREVRLRELEEKLASFD